MVGDFRAGRATFDQGDVLVRIPDQPLTIDLFKKSHAILIMVFISRFRAMNNKALSFLVVTFFMLSSNLAEAKEYSLGTQEESKMVDAKVIESPPPEIPTDLRDEAFKSSVSVRFNIEADGKVGVKLLDSSGSEDIDKLILGTLKKWKFKPATVDDRPVPSSRKLKIELEIE